MKHLKDLRLEEHFTQKDVAERLGIDRTTYVKYETGASEPNFEMFLKIAEIFHVSADYLLGISESKRPEKNELPFTDSADVQNILANSMYDRLSAENKKKADSYLEFLLDGQATKANKE